MLPSSLAHLVGFFLITSALAAPAASLTPASTCTSFIVPLTVSNVTTIVPPFQPFPNGYAATAFLNLITSRDSASASAMPQLSSVTKTFNISIEYCTPKVTGTKASTLQLLTHGLGFDKTYWDFKIPGAKNITQYSYVDTALTAGYSTLSWDRLGCGLSTAADPYHDIQASVELAILVEITTLLREGKLSTNIPKPQHLIHVGHSWGSQLTDALASSTAGNLSDAIVLTGYNHLTQYQPLFLASTNFHLASANQPHRFHNHSSGYLTWADKFSNQYSFFSYPHFDPAVLTYAESTKWPFTAGEFISQDALNYNATNYKGPVLYLAGQNDLIYCDGDCGGKLMGPTSPAVTTFSSSRSVEVYIQPNTGHAINLHKNATAAFEVVMGWVEKQGF